MKMPLDLFLAYPVLGNTLGRFLAFALSIVFAFVLGRTLHHFFSITSKCLKTESQILYQLLKSCAKAVDLVALALGFKLALGWLFLSEEVRNVCYIASDLGLSLAFTYFCFKLVHVFSSWILLLSKPSPHCMNHMLLPSLKRLLQGCILILFGAHVFQLLSDQPISSILAGLGIGGLAVAMAARETIANFFGSLVIFIDKPFELGDNVKIDTYQGLVEEVGLRSTRLRTLDGALITLPNAGLTTKSIENLSKTKFRRKTFSLDLKYGTPASKVEEALSIVRSLLQDHEGLEPHYPPVVYLSELKESGLSIAVILAYRADFTTLNAFCERLYLRILKAFEAAKIELAPPRGLLV